MRGLGLAVAALAVLAAGSGCARQIIQQQPLPPLPTLPVDEPVIVATAPPSARYSASPDPWAGLPPGPPVTLSAVDVDARALAMALAEVAEVNLILQAADTAQRITVHLVEVPALDALREVLAVANLGVAAPPPAPLWEPVVFYVLPVDVERADVQLIRSRFRVSEELARFVVETRVR